MSRSNAVLTPESQTITSLDCDTDTRLKAITQLGIVEASAEQAFDDLTQLAAQICDAPVALVSVVEKDRQWFKAKVGFTPSETPIDQSVCAHALGSREMLVIPDLMSDPRTMSNPIVTGEPHIRFYAGAPLVTEDGIAIGSLCVIDYKPRPAGLTQKQVSALSKLADQVMAQFALRRALADREDLVAGLSRAHGRAAEERRRLTSMFQAAPSFMALLRGPEHVFDMTNAAYQRMVGGRDVLGRSVREALPDAAEQGFADLLDKVYRTGEVYQVEAALFASQASPEGPVDERYLDFVYQPLEENGEVTGIFVEGYDVTDRVWQIRRQEALSELGERLRDSNEVAGIATIAAEILAGLLGATRAGFGSVDLQNETVFMHPNWCAPGAEPVEGTYRFRDYGSFIDDLVAGRPVLIEDIAVDERTRDSENALAELGIRVLCNLPILEDGKLVMVVFVHHDTARQLSNDDLAFIRQVGDRAQAAIARIQAEKLQKVLNQELSHRLKNTLAMVQAIAGQTLRSVTEKDAVEAFNSRIHALSTAHQILLQENWSAAPIRNVVSGVVKTLNQSDRFALDGPDVVLGARAALSMTLVLHELATNAIKYGALSVEAGSVSIEWCIDHAEEDTFALTWTEQGGPAATEPDGRGGFGSRLIKMGLLGTGSTSINYGTEGLQAEMRAPLSQMQQI
ncbi:GAF domain-containing protein [Pararhizobium mangrovi]|uniref:histidine kinase n=1 Tax=Pararhizobium mangrovi TaxID=2590452 RepID=A0A506TWU2_9HYPH|nr:GAF domain-containing protein [Pararhizobium mangrovi]TPW26543.1 GAF domain-containing protein [Pararhizobium mangrovi]